MAGKMGREEEYYSPFRKSFFLPPRPNCKRRPPKIFLPRIRRTFDHGEKIEKEKGDPQKGGVFG